MVVETLRSTDAGVAYLVQAEGLSIYHAGDLHWWNSGMEGELTPRLTGCSTSVSLNRIKNRHIDLAFVVLSASGGCLLSGHGIFSKKYGCDLVFLMAMWKQYDPIDRFKQTELVGLSQKGCGY